MLIFIDESGDPGFKIGKGSSPFFVFVLVIFDDNLEAERTAVSIKLLKRQLRLQDNYEFKFDTINRAIRNAFIDNVRRYQFRVRALVVDKKIVRSLSLRTKNEHFYNYFIMQLLEKSKGYIKNAHLYIDQRGERNIRKQLRAYLSSRLENSKSMLFEKIKFVDSKTNSLIQLADIIAGSLYCKYSKKDDTFVQKLQRVGRMEDIWEFR